MEFHTASSPTTGQTSIPTNSGPFAPLRALGSTMLRSLTPQSNGQAERANGLILKGLKPRLMRDLKNAAGAWVDELPSVLWGLRTTPNRSTGRTPFFLVYRAEAVIPSDLLHNAPRVELYSEDEAEQARQDAVDLLEEEREMAMIRSTIYQQDLRRFHARNVKSRAFQEGDLVL